MQARFLHAGVPAPNVLDNKTCTAAAHGHTIATACPLRQFEAGAFDIVVDKGGLDALMGENTPDAGAAGAALLAEVARLAAASGGAYACVTLAQAHVLRAPCTSRPYTLLCGRKD